MEGPCRATPAKPASIHTRRQNFYTRRVKRAKRKRQPARWWSDWSTRFVVGRPGVHSLSRIIPTDFKKMVLTASLFGFPVKKEIVWRTSRQACLLCPWARHLTGHLHFYVADRWPTRTSPGYNCEVAHPACRKRRLLGTQQWQSALLWWGYQSFMTGSKWAAIFS